MNLHQLVSDVISDTQGVSLPRFIPELVVCGTIILMLFIRLFRFGKYVDSFYLVLAGSIAAFAFSAPWNHLQDSRVEIFTGMLVVDGYTVLMRSILLIFAILFAIFTRLSGLPDKDDGPDIYSLVMGGTLGMMLMCSANHLLMVFMAVEMASVPSYALAGMLKGRRQSSEAALKYSVYGAGTAGVMLYGISLIAGVLNSAHLPTLAVQLADRLPSMQSEQLMVLALGGLMIGVGLAFKLSAVPFHFWCPDVFEGATAEVNAFLSVASKAAALVLLVRVAIGFGVITSDYSPVAQEASTPQQVALYAVADEPAHSGSGHEHGGTSASNSPSDKPVAPRDRLQSLSTARSYMAKLIAFFAIITCTFGNLAAYGQTNIKRLLAYSTIAHAGYMMMAVPAIVAAAGIPEGREVATQAAASLGIYIGVYVAMNLGVFVVVAFLRNAMRSEEIADYAGLLKRAPITVICFSVMLFSLIGMPPLAGFVGKFAVFAALARSYEVVTQNGQSGNYLLWLLVVGGINTAISLFYYLRVVKVMTIDPEPRLPRPMVAPIGFLQGCYLCLVTLPTLGWIICWESLAKWCTDAAEHLL